MNSANRTATIAPVITVWTVEYKFLSALFKVTPEKVKVLRRYDTVPLSPCFVWCRVYQLMLSFLDPMALLQPSLTILELRLRNNWYEVGLGMGEFFTRACSRHAVHTILLFVDRCLHLYVKIWYK